MGSNFGKAGTGWVATLERLALDGVATLGRLALDG